MNFARVVAVLVFVSACFAFAGAVFELPRAYAVNCPGPTCNNGCHTTTMDLRLSTTTCNVISAHRYSTLQGIHGLTNGQVTSQCLPKAVPGNPTVGEWSCNSGVPNCGGNGIMDATAVSGCPMQPTPITQKYCPTKC
jgi:hypothetical protein